jgi:glycosyltransferase involved in cell wall biosynthesis
MKIFLRDTVKIIISPRTPSQDAVRFYFGQQTAKKMLWNYMIKFFCKHSDSIIVASEGLKEECIAAYKAKRSKIFTVHNSIDFKKIERFSLEPIETECPLDYSIISTAGRLSAEKNMDVLMKAFALLRDDVKVKLWIIGDGPERPHLESLASDLNIMDDVVFWGFHKNFFKLIRNSDVFVHTSLFEGFGNSILEAMACGVPVIATDCPFGPREIINNGNDGILVPVSDQETLAKMMRMVLENKEKKDCLVKNAYKRVSEFTPERMVKGYQEVFLSLAHSLNPVQCGEVKEASKIL